MPPWYVLGHRKQRIQRKVVSKVTNMPKIETPGTPGRFLVGVPTRFLAALIMIAVMAIAFGLAVHGFHHANMAGPGISWVHPT